MKFQLLIMLILVLSVYSSERKKNVGKIKSEKGFFNMKGLALVATFISKYNGKFKIVDNYKAIVSRCVSLSSKRIYHKIKLYVKKFDKLYYLLRRINAVVYVRRDEKFRNHFKKDLEEFSKLNILNEGKKIYSEIKGKKISRRRLIKLKNLIAKNPKNKSELRKKNIKKLLRKIIYKSFKLFYSNLTKCRAIPKKLRNQSKHLIKYNLREMFKNDKLIKKLELGMKKISRNFDKITIRKDSKQLINNLKLISNYFLTILTKNKK